MTDFIFPVKVKGKINVSLIKEDNAPEKNSDNNTQVTAAETGTVTLDNFNGVSTFNQNQVVLKFMHRACWCT